MDLSTLFCAMLQISSYQTIITIILILCDGDLVGARQERWDLVGAKRDR